MDTLKNSLNFVQFIQEIYPLTLIQLFAVITPGNDFVLVLRNSLTYSRKIAIGTALGIAFGIFLHIIFSLTSLNYIIANDPEILILLKLFSGTYVIYLGMKSIFTEYDQNIKVQKLWRQNDKDDKAITFLKALSIGLLTNISNPKVILFFLSIFTAFININTSTVVLIFYSIEMPLITFLWFSLVGCFLTNKDFQKMISKYKGRLEKLVGIMLVICGYKLIFS